MKQKIKIFGISAAILLVLVFLLLVISMAFPGLWAKYLSHWIILPIFALIITLLIGLVLMDNIFELDSSLVITLKRSRLKIEIKKYLIWAFFIVCMGAIFLELIQFLLSQSNTSLLDPVATIGGSVSGIILHILGSKWFMKRVEFELDRWESNVL